MKLERKLGFWDVFCIAAGAMISSGLFILPGIAFELAGPAVVLSYALAGIMIIPAMLSQAELATAMPRSGGSYFFIERSMGAFPGTLAGLANWFSIALKSAFALIGIGAFAKLVFPGVDEWTIKLVAISFCVLFTLLNIFSVKKTGRLQVFLVAGLILILLLFVVRGMPMINHKSYAGFMDKGFLSMFLTSGAVFVSFGGLTQVASVSGEVRKPGRNIPAGMFSACTVVSLFYVAAVFITVGVLDAQKLSGSLTPLSLAADAMLGTPGKILLSIGAMLAFITTANGGILSASRSPMAMSRDGLLPTRLRVVSKFGTPHVSIILTSGFMIVLISALSITVLVKVASTMMLMLFLLVNLSVLIMRHSRIQNYRPLYKAPFFPWLQWAGIAIYLLLIVNMGKPALITTGLFALCGAAWYLIYVRPRIRRESAFVYMVKNIVSRKIYRSELEDELKEIALERDEVTHDRFDRLVKRAEVMDLEKPISAEELFEYASEVLSQRLGIDKERLIQLFREREAQSSTVIQPGLAIPHVIVEGTGLFDILLIRCKEGIHFPGKDEPVRTAFILVGSPDERNYHLRALMAIAHIVGEKDFFKRWVNARNPEQLRDILLLSERNRDDASS